MRFAAWLFSARLAWSRHWIKLATLLALGMSLAGSAWFLGRVLPIAKAGGVFAYHYTIYFGIDDLRGWGWVFVLPSAWIALTVIDLLFAYGTYRKDQILASCLFAIAVLWGIPWIFTMFYLALINASL
jgi:hypothetical protein